MHPVAADDQSVVDDRVVADHLRELACDAPRQRNVVGRPADQRLMRGGFNADALAWYAADQAPRMMTGQPSNANVNFPYQRMFTSSNINDLALTPAAEKSGEWYGSTDYQNGFLKLWGLNG